MEKQALLSMLQDLAPSELFEGVESAQSAKELLPLLDAELQRCTNRMQRIQQYRNKLSSPMYTLLPELLSKIFVIYAQDQLELFNLRWTKLLLVCRRWYDVGVSTPKLWSYISLVDPSATAFHFSGNAQLPDARLAKRIEAQLARAGTAPLTIKTGALGRRSDASESMKPYRSVFWNAGSLASLSLSGDKTNVTATLNEMARHRHPVLKEISIVYEGIRFHIGTGPLPTTPHLPSNTPIPLPDNLLGDNSPKLSTISISGVTLNWALVQNLRALHATFDDNTTPATSLDNIADALARCPRLEDLQMMLPTSFLPNGAETLASIPLRSLRKATIRANSDICAALFQAFTDMPCRARISLLSATTSTPQQISRLSSLLGTHGRIDGAPTIRVVSIAQGAVFANGIGMTIAINGNVQGGDLRSTQLCVAARTYLDRQRHFDMPFAMTPTGSIRMCLTAIPNNDTQPENVLADILQSWPLASATCLDIRSCRSVPIEIWRALFDNAPGVTTVILRPEAAALLTLMDFLTTALREDGRRIVKNIILDMGEVSFGHMSSLFGGGGVLQETPNVRARVCLMRLLQYCTNAAQAGVPLDTIELVNDNVHQQGDRMIQTVPETDWSELYRDLGEGFVYEGFLRNVSTGPEGARKDSFVGSKTSAHNEVHRYARRYIF
ncbi:unnamed protein product [Peniophora sp. CBMAI 1063]|nr:unnamed protein product [Peniophora sp. CBMAI 1063]